MDSELGGIPEGGRVACDIGCRADRRLFVLFFHVSGLAASTFLASASILHIADLIIFSSCLVVILAIVVAVGCKDAAPSVAAYTAVHRLMVGHTAATNHNVLLLARLVMMISLVIAIFIVLVTFISCQHVVVMHSADIHLGLSSRWKGPLITPATDELIVVILAVTIVDHLAVDILMHHQMLLLSVILRLRVIAVRVFIVPLRQLPIDAVDIVASSRA